MAYLTTVQRKEVARDLMAHFSHLREHIGAVLKTEFYQAIVDTDEWLEDNKAAYNAALSQPARGELTSSQKAFLMEWVSIARRKAGAF